MNDIALAHLNYHHLQYFFEVAREGNLTRAAERLRVSQSALSVQIRALEDQLGTPLFDRVGRRLVLTEAGQIAAAHAERIFTTGRALLGIMREGRSREERLKVGVVSTLSRNFQASFLAPLLRRGDVSLTLRSGSLEELGAQLAALELDVILSNRAAANDAPRPLATRLLARQNVSLVGRPRLAALAFPECLGSEPLLLPGRGSELREGFDALCTKLDVTPRVLAEVDDMAMLRVLARDVDAIALLPSVVVRDELRDGRLVEHAVVPGLSESFYALTVERAFPHPLVRALVSRSEDDLLTSVVPTTLRRFVEDIPSLELPASARMPARRERKRSRRG